MRATDQHSDLDDFLAEELTSPEEREEFERIAAMVSFGNALGYMREQRGMTQKQLAEMTGIQRSVIARLENGDHAPTLTTQTRLARALNAEIRVGVNGQIDFVPIRAPRVPRGKRVRKTAMA